MKTLTYFTLAFIFAIACFSCASEDIRLYHPEEEKPEPEPEPEPEPVKHWLLKHVDYPSDKLGLVTRSDVTLSYNSELQIGAIDNQNSDYITINYTLDSITYAKDYKSSTSMVYDSLLVRINATKQATSALHVTYRETDGTKIQTQNDSTFFGYNTEGNLIRMERFNRSGDKTPTYWEDYTFTDGNLTEVLSSAGYKHIYTYNEQKYSLTSSYCYEVPFNTISISSFGGCWLLTNCRFLSNYLGKKSANNIGSVTIYKNAKEGQTPELLANLNYEYLYNEYELVTEVKLTGIVNGVEIPENYTTAFSYIEKTEGEEESVSN